MSLLDSVMGALTGADLNSGKGQANALRAVVAMLSEGGGSGGLAGLVQQFQQVGLGDLVGSWISTGRNLPVSPSQLESALGAERIGQLAEQLGISRMDAAGQLSEWLPRVVDRLTPDGHLPLAGSPGAGDLGDMNSLLARFTSH